VVNIDAGYTVNAGGVCVVSVIAHLVGDEHNHYHTNGHGYCQSKNINGGKELMAFQTAKGSLEIVNEHGILLRVVVRPRFTKTSPLPLWLENAIKMREFLRDCMKMNSPHEKSEQLQRRGQCQKG
jgi:hypothetical protein